MFGLLVSTLLTSAADSINPVAITQQFVLQGMVKKPKHIWFFILSTGITNLIGGFLAYYGVITFIGKLLNKLIEKYGQALYTTELILGIAFLIAVGILLQNNKIESLKKQIHILNDSVNNGNSNHKAESTIKIKSVSPMALVALGIGATISELTTALPYFAFLTILFNHQLTVFQITFILILYNTIYTLPLIILFFIYIKAQDKFDYLYGVVNTQVTKFANIFAPTIVGIIGIILVYHSMSILLK